MRSFLGHLCNTCGYRRLCFTKVDSQITNKMQVWSILSIWKIVWWTVSRDIHSICIVSKHVLDAERMWEELLTISASHLWVTPCNFPTLLTLKLHTKYQIFNTLSVQNRGYLLCYQERHTLLMRCSKTFFRCIKLMVLMSFLMHLSAIHRSHPDIFHQGWLSKCTQNAKF